MKESLTNEIKEIFTQSRTWVEIQVEYAKLTAAEKFTLMTSTFVVGSICMLLGMVVIILLSFALTDVFKLIMAPALAYLTVSGILILLIILIYVFRQALIYNPIARYMTRLLLGAPVSNDSKQENEAK